MSSAGGVVGLPAQPVTIADEQAGVNSAIAAALTRWVGSMPALYVVLVIVGGWMAAGTWGPLREADPYPFPFLLFLNNVLQLVLCLVILVGQRVLGGAADHRAVQTYENTEAIFERIAGLQAHLDRHDQALSRGVSLLESSPHPWIERHRVQRPPQAIDQAVSLNGRVAAWLTRRLGSVWAFYLAAGTQLVWIVGAQLGAQRVDPYPFAFMTFLSTLAQLIFMIVIMVGQDVLGRAGDRRSEQTYLDAEAVLHECRRMKARLTAQDRVIDSLTGYTSTQVTEQLAQAIHDADTRPPTGDGATVAVEVGGVGGGVAEQASRRPWGELPEPVKQSARAQARAIGESLAAIGALMVPTFDSTLSITFSDDEVEILARLEHQRRLGERAAHGTGQGAELVAWEELPERARAASRQAVWRLPAILAGLGYQVVRDGRAQDGPRESDFTTGEWDTLQQAMMAAGVLVSLAEGSVDTEEIFALVKTLREASITHPRRFIRELCAACTFNTGLQTGTTYTGYKPPALAAIGQASAIVADKAPGELAEFRAFLTEIATVVADANKEGGFFGLGAQRRTDNEAAAITAINTAAGLDDTGQPG